MDVKRILQQISGQKEVCKNCNIFLKAKIERAKVQLNKYR